jgi:hypothetical protein
VSYKLNDLTYAGFQYSKEVEALMKYIKEHWDIKATPKGYKAYLEKYADQNAEDLEELDIKKVLDSFEGHGEGGTTSSPFAISVRIPHVAFRDKEHGHSPIETLIGAVLTYGMLLGKQLAVLDPLSEANIRLSLIKHAYDMINLITTDEPMEATYEAELRELFNTTKYTKASDVHKKYDGIRLVILRDRLEEFKEYLKDKAETTVTKDSVGIKGIFWKTLFDLNAVLSDDGFKKLMTENEFVVEHDGRMSYTVRKIVKARKIRWKENEKAWL